MDNINEILNECAGAVLSRYSVFRELATGNLSAVMAGAVDNLAPRRFARAMAQTEATLLPTMMDAVNLHLDRIQAEIDGEPLKVLQLMRDDLVERLRVAYQTQMRLDTQSAKTEVLRFVLAVAGRVNAGQSKASAIIATQNSQFAFVDRAGRRWNSERYIWALTRGELVSSIFYAFGLWAEKSQDGILQLSDGSEIAIAEIERYAHPNARVFPAFQIVK